MDKLLSANDIEKVIGYPVKVALYDDLSHAERVEELLDVNGVCLILVRCGPNVGHWVVLVEEDDVITFFDSYGGFVDDQLGHTPIRYKPELSRLLSEYDGDVHYNPYQLQKFGSDIATCGRWCAFYVMNRAMDVDDFVKVMKKYKRDGVNLDELVTNMTGK